MSITITRNVLGAGRNAQRTHTKELAAGEVCGVIESLSEMRTTISIRVDDTETYDITFHGSDALRVAVKTSQS